MAPSRVHLPNGVNLTVTPIFGGLSFKADELANSKSVFPPGWSVMLYEKDPDEPDDLGAPTAVGAQEPPPGTPGTPLMSPALPKKPVIHRYKRPTLNHDHIYISTISSPNTAEWRPSGSPTRSIAMMLWAFLWWYFHQPQPDLHVDTKESASTPLDGRPKGDWVINIDRNGVFKGKNTLSKLERMGLITSEDSTVGYTVAERNDFGYGNMFVSRRAFWQIDARIYLFTMMPMGGPGSPLPGGSPFGSRPSSPSRAGGVGNNSPGLDREIGSMRQAHTPSLQGPFQSSSHLPTYYPPHPAQYTYCDGLRHPIRPKPFQPGETFYCRYVPSVNQYLSFRTASLSAKGIPQVGPWSHSHHAAKPADIREKRSSVSDPIIATLSNLELEVENDTSLLHRWMNVPRVARSWGEDGPKSHQQEFLRRGLASKHSFPVIGCWDGKPFGYFEIYWVKEDDLGKHIGGSVGDWDRGIHCLVGEQEYRGPQRAKIWLSSLIHYCWLADMRTNCVMLEPRVDNEKMAKYCYEVGFFKEREVTFPHKQSNLFKIYRDAWNKPFI